jgi:hypothetical protein
MRFLEGRHLTAAIKRLISTKGELRLAVAYWGADGLKLMGVNPKRSKLKVICCLKGGKSDPDLIKKFGKRAKQNDRLHAKIVWTANGAIISSANASSNGLPEEEDTAAGLIEAGVFISGQTELKAIGAWINLLFRRSKAIKQSDLDAARTARKKRIWGTPGKKSQKQSLIKALSDGGKLEFDQQRVFFAFYKYRPTRKQVAAAEVSIRKNKSTIVATYKLSDAHFQDLDWYNDWPHIPTNAFLIDCQYRKGSCRFVGVYRTFDSAKAWKVEDNDGEVQRLTLARAARRSFPYKITPQDEEAIKKSADRLWRLGGKDRNGRIIALTDAASILLRDHLQKVATA